MDSKKILESLSYRIIRSLKIFFITIEEIISIDKSGRTYYNTSNNYRNSEISYKKNSYINSIK